MEEKKTFTFRLTVRESKWIDAIAKVYTEYYGVSWSRSEVVSSLIHEEFTRLAEYHDMEDK